MKKLLGIVLVLVMAGCLNAAVINIVNGDFESGDIWATNSGTAPEGWVASGSYVSGQRVPGLPGMTACWQDRDGLRYYEQQITSSDAGDVDAGTYSLYEVTFDYGYRRDSSTNGPINLLVSLRDTTEDVELASENIIIPDPGRGTNFLTTAVVVLYIEGTAGNGLALRFTENDPGSRGWTATTMIDNISLITKGDVAFSPSPADGLIRIVINSHA
ncbi:hypothetical protein STSP2_02278 [Anaerohalosphaera lusitana]|uniref:DUF642 domain-containing protein n=1 Tax=Anaerohalosphaera lusitana TaxID=1936003 RepID=A0A1U9NME6_9BACT|nr:hypothetical protein [Anaerohalosphaera lusitana]AQT69091.1 hypothetical protein STSP2_02278 [Anaerohalosphaera lusitana]